MPNPLIEKCQREIVILSYAVDWLAEELENRYLNEFLFRKAQIPAYSKKKWIELAIEQGKRNT